MVKWLPRPGNSVRLIIFFDLGIYSSARDLQHFFGQSDVREMKSYIKHWQFLTCFCVN